MPMLWIVMTIHGVVQAYMPVGHVTMKQCQEIAAMEMMKATSLFGRADFKCVSRGDI